MAQSTGSDAPQPEARSGRVGRRRPARHRETHLPESHERPSDEAGFWAQLEERDDGRLALEADHLFDTSYLWAA